MDIDKLMTDLTEFIDQGLVYIGDEVNGYKAATDVRWLRLMFAKRACIAIGAGPEGKDTLDERPT